MDDLLNAPEQVIAPAGTPTELRADGRAVPFVSRPGTEVNTGASFAVPDRTPTLQAM